jgi:hypothetical protein
MYSIKKQWHKRTQFVGPETAMLPTACLESLLPSSTPFSYGDILHIPVLSCQELGPLRGCWAFSDYCLACHIQHSVPTLKILQPVKVPTSCQLVLSVKNCAPIFDIISSYTEAYGWMLLATKMGSMNNELLHPHYPSLWFIYVLNGDQYYICLHSLLLFHFFPGLFL